MSVSSHAPPPEASGDRNGSHGVVLLMAKVIERLDARLTPDQRGQLARAMPAILWQFPDAAAAVHLIATPESLHCATSGEIPPLVVRMPLQALDDAAFGRRSLAASFLAGRITVRGMSPARLREFILLVHPLLESYREAACEQSDATTPDVS